MPRVSLAVYTRAGVLVSEPETWWPEGQGIFLDELDDQGSFQFNVQADDPDVESIEAGHIVVVSIDASPVWRGVIRKRTWREVADDEAGRYATFTGTGEVGRLDEAVVYPEGGLGRYPFSDERAFNWTAIAFIDAAWQPAIVTPANYGTTSENYGLPEGFPWGGAEWIWDQDSSGTVPGGIKYMRKAVNVAEAGVFEAWSAADDRNEVWAAGKSILKSSDAPYDGRTTPVELYMTTGWVQFAARVENRNDLKAGFLFGVGKPLDDTFTPFALTDSTWLIAPDGAPLGMTAGYIMNILLDEFVARGGVSPTRTWTDTLDSNGDPWTVYEEITVQVMTTTYLDVLRQMVELEMCDFRMSPTGYELNLYNAGGAGDLVAFTLDNSNLTSLTWDTVPAVASALLVRWDRGYTDTQNAGLVSAHGRRESGLSLAGINAETTAETQAGQVITRHGNDRTEVAAGFDPAATTDEPYTMFGPGDSLTVPVPGQMLGWNDGTWNEGEWNGSDEGSSPQRVMAVGMGVDDVGNPVWDLHLADHIDELAKRQQVMLKKMAASVGGRSSSSTIPYEPRPIQPREPLEVDWSQAGVVTVSVGAKKSFARAIRIREFRMDLQGTITGTYTARLRKNGVAITGSDISRTSAGDSYVTLSTIVNQRPMDYIEAEITAIGGGATRITLTCVYA